MTNMNRRLQQFLDAENITQAQFAARINVAPASISHIIAGRNKPGFDFMQNTIKAFPELNIEWLINGQGKMYRQPAQSTVPQQPQDTAPVTGTLFMDEDVLRDMPVTVEPLRESDKSDVPHDVAANIGIPEREIPLSDILKKSERQRKATKIVVFYDDGTFQEFQ